MLNKEKKIKNQASQIQKDQPVPKFAIKFANMVFILGLIYLFLLLAYVAYRLYVPYYGINLGNIVYERTYHNYILVIIALGILFSLCLRLRESKKINLALLLSTLGIFIYIVEIYFEFPIHPKKQEVAEELGVPFDTRSYMEVIQGLRDEGVNAYPNARPDQYIESNGLKGEAGNIYPLGGISNITTAFHNEGGFYPIIELDEYGFNNPKWTNKKSEVDLVLIGDSFTEGYSVHPNENISAVLRQSDFNVISLGKSGNGPLLEYATLREYAEPIKPKIVVWIYFNNDPSNLLREMQSPLLMQYLYDDNFSQNLMSRQMEIDKIYRKDVNQKWAESNLEGEGERNYPRSLFRIIKLYNLRMFFDRDVLDIEPNFPIPIFKPIMAKAKKLVSGWGGKFYFVYLPSPRESQGNKISELNKYVLDTVDRLDISVIDIHQGVFSSHADPMSLFPLRMQSHYNAEGYRLVAEAIDRRLKADGISPSRKKLN
ncbi:MAG: SGNH/GDSL hydrolase family protein [Nitrospinales bacterium]